MLGRIKKLSLAILNKLPFARKEVVSDAGFSPAIPSLLTVPSTVKINLQVNSNLSPKNQFYEAAKRGDLQEMEALMQQHAINVNDYENGNTPLYIACSMCPPASLQAVVEYLLKHHANPNLANTNRRYNQVAYLQRTTADQAVIEEAKKQGSLPLYIVSTRQYGHLAIPLLVSHGANINALSSYMQHGNETPLYGACRCGHLENVKTLLRLQADPNVACTNNLETALYVAAEHGHHELVQLLLDHHADKRRATLEGKDAIIIASQKQHHLVVPLLSPLDHLLDIIMDEAFWRKKKHFTFQAAPKAILEMREVITVYKNMKVPEMKDKEDILVRLQTIASEATGRCRQTRGMMYLMLGYDSRDETSKLLYALFERLTEINLDLLHRDKIYNKISNEYKTANQLTAPPMLYRFPAIRD